MIKLVFTGALNCTLAALDLCESKSLDLTLQDEAIELLIDILTFTKNEYRAFVLCLAQLYALTKRTIHLRAPSFRMISETTGEKMEAARVLNGTESLGWWMKHFKASRQLRVLKRDLDKAVAIRAANFSLRNFDRAIPSFSLTYTPIFDHLCEDTDFWGDYFRLFAACGIPPSEPTRMTIWCMNVDKISLASFCPKLKENLLRIVLFVFYSTVYYGQKTRIDAWGSVLPNLKKLMIAIHEVQEIWYHIEARPVIKRYTAPFHTSVTESEAVIAFIKNYTRKVSPAWIFIGYGDEGVLNFLSPLLFHGAAATAAATAMSATTSSTRREYDLVDHITKMLSDLLVEAHKELLQIRKWLTTSNLSGEYTRVLSVDQLYFQKYPSSHLHNLGIIISLLSHLKPSAIDLNRSSEKTLKIPQTTPIIAKSPSAATPLALIASSTTPIFAMDKKVDFWIRKLLCT